MRSTWFCLMIGMLLGGATHAYAGYEDASENTSDDDADDKRCIELTEALQIVATQGPDNASANFQVDAVKASHRSAIGRMLPRIFLSDELQRYKDPFIIQFGEIALKARYRGTNTFTVGAVQPFLGLLHINEDRGALANQVDAASQDRLTVQRNVAARIKELFLRLYEARATADNARASERTLNEQVEVAQQKYDTGTLTKADILRIKVAAASAKQNEISAVAQEKKIHAQLLEELGLVQDTEHIDFARPVQLENIQPPKKHKKHRESPRRLALKQRSEVLSMDFLARAADRNVHARWLSLLPEINLEAAYTHITGQVMQPEDQVFIGIKADWTIWEWGAQYFESRHAQAARNSTYAKLESLKRQVGVEVASRQADWDASYNAFELAKLALQSAEEAFRVTQQSNLAGSATTTDLLDAESALTQARLGVVSARYACALAQVDLDLAMGNP